MSMEMTPAELEELPPWSIITTADDHMFIKAATGTFHHVSLGNPRFTGDDMCERGTVSLFTTAQFAPCGQGDPIMYSPYRVRLLDPRPQAREAELAFLKSTPCMGIEVTIPELADACRFGNIDPQHTGQDANAAAIDIVTRLGFRGYPPAGTVLVTVKPDADAFGSMAALSMYDPYHHGSEDMRDRQREIGHADRSPEADDAEVSDVAALRAVCEDNSRTAGARVDLCREYLLTGTFAGIEKVRDAVARERRQTAEIAATVEVHDGIAVVESTSRLAIVAAYRHADVVVAVNPQFRHAGGEPHRKVTICQARPGLVDLAGVFAELGEREPGWGGSPTIGGSPQGIACGTPLDEIVAIVAKHRTS